VSADTVWLLIMSLVSFGALIAVLDMIPRPKRKVNWYFLRDLHIPVTFGDHHWHSLLRSVFGIQIGSVFFGVVRGSQLNGKGLGPDADS
jgi:hypothetical protein